MGWSAVGYRQSAVGRVETSDCLLLTADRREQETSMLGWLRARRRAELEAKASRAGALVALHAAGRPVWTPRSYPALARAGYMKNPVVHRAVRMVAEAAASVPWLLRDGRAELDGHPLLDLLAQPNPRQAGPDLLQALYGHLLISGNAYVEAVTLEGELRELHALRPDRMSVVPDARGWPAAYDYTANGRTMRFHQDGNGLPAILHLAEFHPLDDHYGLPPLEAAQVSLDVHNAANAWNKALELPAILDLGDAERLCGAVLRDIWAGRESAALALPPSDAALDPGDMLMLGEGSAAEMLLVERVEDARVGEGRGRRLQLRRVDNQTRPPAAAEQAARAGAELGSAGGAGDRLRPAGWPRGACAAACRLRRPMARRGRRLSRRDGRRLPPGRHNAAAGRDGRADERARGGAARPLRSRQCPGGEPVRRGAGFAAGH
jgi:hypothetical protein